MNSSMLKQWFYLSSEQNWKWESEEKSLFGLLFLNFKNQQIPQRYDIVRFRIKHPITWTLLFVLSGKNPTSSKLLSSPIYHRYLLFASDQWKRKARGGLGAWFWCFVIETVHLTMTVQSVAADPINQIIIMNIYKSLHKTATHHLPPISISHQTLIYPSHSLSLSIKILMKSLNF